MSGLVLEIVEGKEAGRQVPLAAPVEIGREPGVSIMIDDGQVSRHHARISPSGDGAVVEDLGSLNGTYVNAQPIRGSRPIVPGDRVRFGLTVMELRSPAQVAAQPSAVQARPRVTELEIGVLRPVPEAELPAPVPDAEASPVLTEEQEPAFAPRGLEPPPPGEGSEPGDYDALVALADSRVKQRTTIAAFALLSITALVVLIYFGS